MDPTRLDDSESAMEDLQEMYDAVIALQESMSLCEGKLDLVNSVVNSLTKQMEAMRSCLTVAGIIPETFLSDLQDFTPVPSSAQGRDQVETYARNSASSSPAHPDSLRSDREKGGLNIKLADDWEFRGLDSLQIPHIYVCGGSTDDKQSLNSVERLSLTSGAWLLMPSMQQARFGAVAGVVSGKLYVCGGCSGSEDFPLNSVERFDPKLNEWETMPRMFSPRYAGVACEVDDRLYVCGGSGEFKRILDQMECFNPRTLIWESLPSMTHRRSLAGGSSALGRLFVCGGRNEQSALRSVESFDPRKGVWETLPKMQEARVGPAASHLNKTLYVFGGFVSPQSLITVEFISLQGDRTSAWSYAPPMSKKRVGASAVAAAGRLCIFGGSESFYGDVFDALDSAEQYDPVAHTWMPLPPMFQKRSLAATAMLLVM